MIRLYRTPSALFVLLTFQGHEKTLRFGQERRSTARTSPLPRSGSEASHETPRARLADVGSEPVILHLHAPLPLEPSC